MDPDYYENVIQQAKIIINKDNISKYHELLLEKRKEIVYFKLLF